MSEQSSFLPSRLFRPLKQCRRADICSLSSPNPHSPLFPFNYLRTLPFSVSHLSAILPTSSALFHQKPGCTPSGPTNRTRSHSLPSSNLHRLPGTGRWPFATSSIRHQSRITSHFRGHTNVTAAGGRSVLQRYFSLRGAAASIAASNGCAWSNGRERRKRSARRAWAYFS